MARASGIPNPAAGPLPAAREARLIHPVLLFGYFFKTSWNLSISPIPAYTQTQPREQTKMPELQIRDKAEGKRAACSRCPHLTPRREAVIFRYCHGLRCRGPLGHGAECRFSRQQTTTAPSKPLEAAAPRPAHRCFDSHSPATTALDSPIAAATRWTPSLNFGCRGGREGEPCSPERSSVL